MLQSMKIGLVLIITYRITVLWGWFEGKDHFEGWAKSLEFFPGVTSAIINDKLVEDACSMKGNSSVRTNRNKKLGYQLWKEGYVKNVLTKPNVK